VSGALRDFTDRAGSARVEIPEKFSFRPFSWPFRTFRVSTFF
jgi:hypothetical protein